MGNLLTKAKGSSLAKLAKLLRKHSPATRCFHFACFRGPDQDELADPARHLVLVTTSRNQGSELSSSTIIPQMTVVADLNKATVQFRDGKVKARPRRCRGQAEVFHE